MMTTPRVFIGLGLALLAAGCGSTEPVATSNAPVAASSPAASASPPQSSTAPPATEAPGTTAARKKGGVTGTILPRGNELGAWKGRVNGGDRFGGEVTCADEDGKLVVELVQADGYLTRLRFTSIEEPGDAENVDSRGKVVGRGAVTINTENHEIEIDGEPTKVISFSFNALTTPVAGGADSTMTGDGACQVTGATDPGSAPAGRLSLPVTDAEAFVDQMLSVAGGALDPDESAFGAPSVWVSAGLPKSAFKGSAIDASPTSISGFASQDDKNGAFSVYPFAVMDDKDVCVYGFIYTIGSETTPKTKALKADGGECSADEGRERFTKEIVPG